MGKSTTKFNRKDSVITEKQRAENLRPHILERITKDPYLSFADLSRELELPDPWISMIASAAGYKRRWIPEEKRHKTVRLLHSRDCGITRQKICDCGFRKEVIADSEKNRSIFNVS